MLDFLSKDMLESVVKFGNYFQRGHVRGEKIGIRIKIALHGRPIHIEKCRGLFAERGLDEIIFGDKSGCGYYLSNLVDVRALWYGYPVFQGFPSEQDIHDFHGIVISFKYIGPCLQMLGFAQYPGDEHEHPRIGYDAFFFKGFGNLPGALSCLDIHLKRFARRAGCMYEMDNIQNSEQTNKSDEQ
jgi:hypothetical protein